MSESLERLARNQTLFREVNERVETLGEGDASEFECECSNTDCIEKVELTFAAYERIRSNSTWFVVKRDHDIPQIERIVSQDDGYVVVEKFVAEDYMEERDPGSDGSDGSRPASG